MHNDMLRFQRDRRHHLLRDERRRLQPDETPDKAKHYRDAQTSDRRADEEGGRAVHRRRLARRAWIRETFRKNPADGGDVQQDAGRRARHRQARWRRPRASLSPMSSTAMIRRDGQGQGEVRQGLRRGRRRRRSPGANGHLVMAYAFLKGTGLHGNIGTITVDLAANKAEATEGHKVMSVSNGAVEIESTRYPFCFYRRPQVPQRHQRHHRVLPLQPGSQSLHARGHRTPAAEQLKVTWGKRIEEFPGCRAGQGDQSRGRVPG